MSTNKRFGHKSYYKIIKELEKIHADKSHDYGSTDPLANLRGCERLGMAAWIGALIRIQDKVSRLESFTRNGEYYVEESVIDTLNDLANYAILARILYEEQ